MEQSQLEYAIEETKLELQASILATKKQLEEAKVRLENVKQEYPINFQNIIDAQLEVRDYSDGLRALTDLQKEFGFNS
jgi:hypothetical protein